MKLHSAMEPFIPDWGQDGYVVRSTTVRGVSNEHVDDPRLSVKQYTDAAGNLAMSLYMGESRWMESHFTPEQCIQIIACILSKPSMADAAKPLIDALVKVDL